MSRKLILIRHHDEPDDDRVQRFALANGLTPVCYRPYRGDRLPQPTTDLAGTVIFGGQQSAADETSYPFLIEEMRWIRECMALDLPVLGICLGAQLIIRVLGGQVGPLNGTLHEFGFYEVTPTAAGRDFMTEPLHVPEAHYHTFTLPEGVELLASGKNYANQAFRYGSRVYGVQFHPECTGEIFRRWQAADWAPYGEPGAQSREEQDRLLAAHEVRQEEWFNSFLGNFFEAGELRS